LQTRRKWDDILEVLEEKYCQPGTLYLENLSFTNEGEKDFPDKTKLWELINTELISQETLRGVIQVERKGC
jgi:hypothetical protein